MKKNFKLYIGLAILGFASSCAPTLDEFEPSKGTADFSKFIAIGNSLTSGYADNGLYLEGQKVAFPNLMAEQFKAAGGGNFTSPFFSVDQENGSGYLRFLGLKDGRPQTEPVTDKLAIRGQVPGGRPLYTKYTDPIQNLGVPGMRLDLAFVPIFGSATVMGNPYFERLLPDDQVGKKSYFDYAKEHEHTFFSFWLGNNDVLGYATNGAVESDPTNTLTNIPTFTALYNNFLTALTANQQKGVVATIPDVTAVPFFNTVTVALVNAAIAANPESATLKLLIKTKTGVRPAETGDLLPLTFDTNAIGKVHNGIPGYGVIPQNPIEDSKVLDKDEVIQVADHVKKVNEVIKSIAADKKLAVADVYTFLNKVKNGYIYNGIGISSAYITGNAFSLDGVHLTPMGNAIVANLFIDAINNTYGSSIAKIDISNYRGIKFP